MKKFALLAGVGLAALGSIAPAEAQGFYGRHGWHGGHAYYGGWGRHYGWRHRGGAVAAGLVGGAILGGLAAAAASPYYYGYGYPAYDYGYDYAPVVYRVRPVRYTYAYPAYGYYPYGTYYRSGKVPGAAGTAGPSNSPPLVYWSR